ncbi:MAG TPA: LCP family protein [Candidatus Scatomorpha pullicola]|nr:LCP family protein [Candidatus Scatomorpha pullicola]
MHLFGGNGKNGRHSASGRGSNDERNYDRYEEYEDDYGGYDEPEYESRGYDSFDDGEYDFDYDRRYRARQQRYASRSAARDGREQRFASDDIISREERERGRRRWPRRLAVTFGILAVVIIGAFAWYRNWARAPETGQGGLNDYGTPVPEETGVAAVAPENAANHRDGVYTFLISGIDVVGYHNDTNLVGMFDTVAGKLNIVSLPRDMLVNVNLNIKKINQPYAAAKNNSQDATQALLDTVADVLGYQVDMYAFVNIEAAADIVDAIGGVNFNIPFDMDWDAPDQDLYIHIKAGPQTLNGENFVNAMRFRMSNDGSHSYAGGDIERIEFQQQLLMALAQQLLQIGNVLNIGEIYSAVMDNTETNVSLGNIAYLLEQFMKLSSDDITFQTIPNRMDGMINGLNYVMPIIDEWLVMLNDYLNPFDQEITESNINMISYIDGVWTMTQGYIEGGEESFAYFG